MAFATLKPASEMGSLGSVACAEADGHKIILRMNS